MLSLHSSYHLIAISVEWLALGAVAGAAPAATLKNYKNIYMPVYASSLSDIARMTWRELAAGMGPGRLGVEWRRGRRAGGVAAAAAGLGGGREAGGKWPGLSLTLRPLRPLRAPQGSSWLGRRSCAALRMT